VEELIFTLNSASEEEGSKMGRARRRLKKDRNHGKYGKDRVLRGKIICKRASGSIRYDSEGGRILKGVDRCYVAMKKLDNWRKYSLSAWRESEISTVETDLECEEISSDSEEIISIHSSGGGAEEVAESVDQVVLSDDSDNEVYHNESDENDESNVELNLDDRVVHNEEENGEDVDIMEGLNTPVLDTINSEDSDDGDSVVIDEGIMSIDFPGIVLFSDRDRDRYGWRFCGQDLDRMRTEHEGAVMYELRDVVFFFGGEFSPSYRMKAIPCVINSRVKAPFYHTTLVFGRKLMDEYGWSSFRNWSREWNWRIYAMRNIVEGRDPVEIVAVNICRRDGHGSRSNSCWCENRIRAEDDIQDSLFHMSRLARLAESATSALLRRDDEFMQFVSNCCSERLALATAMLTDTFVEGSAGVGFSDYFDYTSKIRIRG
jgi:hypothetical protein